MSQSQLPLRTVSVETMFEEHNVHDSPYMFNGEVSDLDCM